MNKSTQNIDNNFEAQSKKYEAVIEDSGIIKLIQALDHDLQNIVRLVLPSRIYPTGMCRRTSTTSGTVKPKQEELYCF